MPFEPFHNFGALKSIARRSWNTLNSSSHGLCGSEIGKGLVGYSHLKLQAPMEIGDKLQQFCALSKSHVLRVQSLYLAAPWKVIEVNIPNIRLRLITQSRPLKKRFHLVEHPTQHFCNFTASISVGRRLWTRLNCPIVRIWGLNIGEMLGQVSNGKILHTRARRWWRNAKRESGSCNLKVVCCHFMKAILLSLTQRKTEKLPDRTFHNKFEDSKSTKPWFFIAQNRWSTYFAASKWYNLRSGILVFGFFNVRLKGQRRNWCHSVRSS